MSATGAHRLTVLLCGGLFLAGCEGAELPGFLQSGSASPERAGIASSTVIEQDSEAPEVFSASERGLWDGRPSLGGVWVAHPDVREPQRVVIRNTANGKSTIGALFRRDGQGSGPRLMISSDAASTLEILAGQPTDLSVVALVRREIEVAPPPSDAAPEGEAATIAAAALAATGTTAAAAADTAGDGVESALGEAVPAAEAPRRGLFGFLRRGQGATAGGAAPDTLSPAAVETAPLDAPAGAATVAAAPAATPAAAPAPASSASGGPDRPYVQIGIFSVEANANDTAAMLRTQGIVPEVRRTQSGERVYWRVLAGPAGSRADLDALLSQVKSLGFADAYFVRG
jgi:cell division septation protein DedD